MAYGVTVSTSSTLAPAQVQAVLELAARAEQADGSPPLNEAAILHLRRTRATVRHLQATRAGDLVGYAQLQDEPGASVGQLVVDPRHRRHGIGAALTDELVALGQATLQMWAAGSSPAAAGLAHRVGLVKVRELLIMQRPLDGDWLRPAPPADVAIRPFRRGEDEQTWLAVNARAFVHHPEQGQITRADLDDRMAEPWFDPAGFLVAVRGETMVGFHWTKQHPG
ncbi:MAG TPA: mycothiol synthase, partial [Propionibacteriaceae bacterium]